VPAKDVLPLLVNELAEADTPAVFVLDDYHVIRSTAVHDSVRFLLEYAPQALHLAIATREDPPFPLGRLRARDDLTEIRGRDLRFSDEQAARFLNDSLGLSLAPPEIRRLQERTEGWAAALQLAGLSLRDHPDPEQFVASFAGDDRQIVDYLGTEVIDRLDSDLRTFLLRTSILGRLSAPLCEAVAEDRHAAERLEELERANLFLVPLDAGRRWFRYHHLFGELLQRRLERESGDLVETLHRRAAAWFRAAGQAEEAIGHAIASGDFAGAAELVAEHWDEFFNRGRLATVSAWLDAIPAEAVERDPRLWLARVWTSLDTGRLDEVQRWLPATDAEWGPLLAALHSFKSGELASEEEGAAWAARAAAETDHSVFWRTVASCVAGVALVWRGSFAQAIKAIELGLELAVRDENVVASSYLLGYQACAELELGDIERAKAALARTEELWRERPELEEHFTASIAHFARGRLLALAGSSGAAESELERALDLARRGAGAIEVESFRAALAGLRRPHRSTAPAVEGDELSERELEVLRLLSTRMSQREIGATLYVSVNTVKSHVKNIFRKLDATGRVEAVARARERGLV
jgi:LuxR family maltose regulon positive regulatory protein